MVAKSDHTRRSCGEARSRATPRPAYTEVSRHSLRNGDLCLVRQGDREPCLRRCGVGQGTLTPRWAQHLNARYLEGRAHKFTEVDSYQLSCAIVVRGRPCIDKSVFRRNVGRRERVEPGQATVDYIRQRFEVAWALLPRSEIGVLERALIASFGSKWDLYNVSGNPRAKLTSPFG